MNTTGQGMQLRGRAFAWHVWGPQHSIPPWQKKIKTHRGLGRRRTQRLCYPALFFDLTFLKCNFTKPGVPERQTPKEQLGFPPGLSWSISPTSSMALTFNLTRATAGKQEPIRALSLTKSKPFWPEPRLWWMGGNDVIRVLFLEHQELGTLSVTFAAPLEAVPLCSKPVLFLALSQRPRKWSLLYCETPTAPSCAHQCVWLLLPLASMALASWTLTEKALIYSCLLNTLACFVFTVRSSQ